MSSGLPGDFHYLPLTKLSRLIEERGTTSLEMTEAILARIERYNPELQCYATVTSDLAIEQAKKADAEISSGIYRGPLHGIPIAVKDLCFTAGITTAGGMTIYSDFVPGFNATVFSKLADAGSVMLGKLRMTEGAILGHHSDLPEPINPWKSDLWIGVSSSGSGVAVAAGLAYGAIGSDTAGSIRFPSACNGVTGVKPTWGRISRFGIFDLAATFDHLGLMARSAADAAVLLQALAGRDPHDPTSLPDPVPAYVSELENSRGLQDVRIGVDWDYVGFDADPETIAMLHDAIAVLGSLGASIQEIEFPSITGIMGHTLLSLCAETAVHHETTYPAQAEEYGPALSGMIEIGRAASPLDVAKGIIERQKFRGAVAAMFDIIDVLATPVFDQGTPTWTQVQEALADGFGSIGKFTFPFNVSGTPTITLPCGFMMDGRPVAVQFAGRHGSESTLLKVAHANQETTGWYLRRPTNV